MLERNSIQTDYMEHLNNTDVNDKLDNMVMPHYFLYLLHPHLSEQLRDGPEKLEAEETSLDEQYDTTASELAALGCQSLYVQYMELRRFSG